METVATNEVEAAVISVDAAEGKGTKVCLRRKRAGNLSTNRKQRNYARGEFVAKESYPAAGCARVSTNENVQLVCRRKKQRKKWQNRVGK